MLSQLPQRSTESLCAEALCVSFDSPNPGSAVVKRLGILLLLFFTTRLFLGADSVLAQSPQEDPNESLRLNQIQVFGTHNSYHIAPSPSLLKSIGLVSRSLADSIDYTHRPLVDQLELLNVRQIELDIYADPQGGLYSNPIGYQTLSDAEKLAEGNPNQDGVLDKPGMKIIHSPGFDYRTTVPTLVMALQQVKSWSDKNRQHVPVMILIELKDSVPSPSGVTPIKFDKQLLDAVDAEIRSVFNDPQMITPDQIRGEHRTLRDAVRNSSWPKLSECRGRVLFALDNGGPLRDMYIEDHPSLIGRVMFASVAPDHPAAAFIKLNDPIGEFSQIQSAIRQGLIVRTRADADTIQARTGDTRRREAALASGAQFISSDYPEPDRRFSDYQTRLPENQEFRKAPLGSASVSGFQTPSTDSK